MAQHRRRIIPRLARKMSGQVRRVSLLTRALHELRLALDRLGREIFGFVAMLICLWHVVSDYLARLVHALF
jgi:hypothetical protein